MTRCKISNRISNSTVTVMQIEKKGKKDKLIFQKTLLLQKAKIVILLFKKIRLGFGLVSLYKGPYIPTSSFYTFMIYLLVLCDSRANFEIKLL